MCQLTMLHLIFFGVFCFFGIVTFVLICVESHLEMKAPIRLDPQTQALLRIAMKYRAEQAASKEEKPKVCAEEKHPGVLAKPGKDGGIEFCWCQKCYAKADVVHDPFGDGEDWSYCKTCGVSFRLKRGEEGK